MTALETFAPPPLEEGYRPERSPALWLLEREIRRYLNIWRYSLVGPVLSGVLFIVVFGTALHGRVGDVQGSSYGRFILPGLLVQAVVTVGFVNGTTSLFEARRDRYINDVFASPLRWWEVNAALVVGGVVREVLVAAGVLGLSWPLVGGIGLARPAVFVAGTTGVLIAAAQAGVIAGALARSLDHVYFMESVLLLPLGFLSGVFYAVGSLPKAWDLASRCDPIFWLVQVERIGMLGGADVATACALGAVWVVVGALTACSATVFATGWLKA
jgi:ABC-2 type transport system permease protein